MNKKAFLIITCVYVGSVVAQPCQTKQIKLEYINGIDIFTVCLDNPTIRYNEKKTYHWYSEVTGSSVIKETTGGAGGQLFQGRETFYDLQGNLKSEHNYNLGLLDGDVKYWDSLGNILVISKYENGERVYHKYKNGTNWNEQIGKMFEIGSITRVYDGYNNIISETTYGEHLIQNVKLYYPYSKTLQKEYSGIGSDLKVGKYVEYYENGNKKVEGQFDDSLLDVKVGSWKWYKNNSELGGKESYKSELQKWDNGKWKIWGGYYFDDDRKVWIKTGIWNWNSEDGKESISKTFKGGVEVKE